MKERGGDVTRLARLVGMMAALLLTPLSGIQAKTYSPDSVRAAMRPLSLESEASYPQPILDYFTYYGLDFKDIPHWFGTYPSDSFTLAAHVFRPVDPRGTLLAVHGYYDHAGIVRNIIRLGIDSGYAVAAIDLPGHGLSSGPRSSIQDFSQYGRAIGDFIRLYGPALPRPLILIGHSTGCAAIVEYLHMYGEKEVAGAVLCAPLVRSTYYTPARIAHWLAASWLKKTGRWFRTESSDRAWLQWYRHEPLQETTFPTEWATAAYAWEARLSNYAVFTLPVAVIQGKKDDTVDWRHNIPVLKTKCTNCTVHLIENGRHQIANEGDEVRGEFLRILGEAIRKPSSGDK